MSLQIITGPRNLMITDERDENIKSEGGPNSIHHDGESIFNNNYSDYMAPDTQEQLRQNTVYRK